MSVCVCVGGGAAEVCACVCMRGGGGRWTGGGPRRYARTMWNTAILERFRRRPLHPCPWGFNASMQACDAS